uniref:FMRFamide-related neuropeptide n=1 Tax=Steinernema glaseri TaxID=37863 RepID=A0A1I8A6U8_9BILA
MRHHCVPESKGSPEMLDPALVYGNDGEMITRVQSQLLGALQLLQAYQDGPTKLAEKRRNKFEFIRFGRK